MYNLLMLLRPICHFLLVLRVLACYHLYWMFWICTLLILGIRNWMTRSTLALHLPSVDLTVLFIVPLNIRKESRLSIILFTIFLPGYVRGNFSFSERLYRCFILQIKWLTVPCVTVIVLARISAIYYHLARSYIWYLILMQAQHFFPCCSMEVWLLLFILLFLYLHWRSMRNSCCFLTDYLIFWEWCTCRQLVIRPQLTFE